MGLGGGQFGGTEPLDCGIQCCLAVPLAVDSQHQGAENEACEELHCAERKGEGQGDTDKPRTPSAWGLYVEESLAVHLH